MKTKGCSNANWRPRKKPHSTVNARSQVLNLKPMYVRLKSKYCCSSFWRKKARETAPFSCTAFYCLELAPSSLLLELMTTLAKKGKQLNQVALINCCWCNINSTALITNPPIRKQLSLWANVTRPHICALASEHRFAGGHNKDQGRAQITNQPTAKMGVRADIWKRIYAYQLPQSVPPIL